jgi:hypothetical protein
VRGPILAAFPAENHVTPVFLRNLRESVAAEIPLAVPQPSWPEATIPPMDAEESTVNLGRAAWLVTVVACLVAVLILILNGYYGYAGVTLAVAISAGINLL